MIGRHWMVAVRAYIDVGGTVAPSAVRIVSSRHWNGTVPASVAMPRECQTCSTFTPSSSWRWRFSSSCGCAVSWASAPAANARLTTPIRRAMPCAARRATKSCRCRRGRRNADAAARSRRAGRRPIAGRTRRSGSAVAAGLDAIVAADPAFDAKHFIAGARAAYEMIVTAFAEGDRRQLRHLLSREVFDGFDAAITERERRGETAETRFVSIDASDHHRRRIAQSHRPDHGALRLQAGFCHARPRPAP